MHALTLVKLFATTAIAALMATPLAQVAIGSATSGAGAGKTSIIAI